MARLKSQSTTIAELKQSGWEISNKFVENRDCVLMAKAGKFIQVGATGAVFDMATSQVTPFGEHYGL